VLKLAIPLVALLALSPVIAKPTAKTAAPKTECIKPDHFPASARVEGADLAKLRAMIPEVPPIADLVLVMKNAPVLIVFSKGCAIGYGVVGPKPTPKGEETL
jgi:hypothetical protein